MNIATFFGHYLTRDRLEEERRALGTTAALFGSDYDVGAALLAVFRGRAGTQQTCLHCKARGGFEMAHKSDCIVDVAAHRLMARS